MAERELSILVRAKGALKAATDIGKVDAKVKSLGGQVSKGLGVGAGIAIADKAFFALGQTVGKIPALIGDATQAFIDDEASQAKLRTALRANVAAYGDNLTAIEKVLTARIALGFSDDEQRESLSGLVAAYGDVEKALESERLAMDLARFSGVDLATASDTLVRVHAGNFRALKALGIETKGLKTENEALAAIYAKVNGQAESFATTLAGRLLVAQTKSAEATEKLGVGTAQLSADFEETKAGAIEKFAIGLDTLTDALNFNSQSLERQIELKRIWDGLNGTSTAARASLGLRSTAMRTGGLTRTGVGDDIATAQDRTRDAVESARIAQVSATRSGDAAIVRAINGIKVNTTVNVALSGGTYTKTTTTPTGTTLVRVGGSGVFGPGHGA